MSEIHVVFGEKTQPGEVTYIHPVSEATATGRTLDPGKPVEVKVSGGTNNVHFDIGIPKGDKGDKGTDGANVLPTAEAIAAALGAPGNAAHTALEQAVTSSLSTAVANNAKNEPRIRLVQDLGADGTGATAADDKWDEAMRILTEKGGGEVVFDGVKFLFERTLRVPMQEEASVPVRAIGRGTRTSASGGEETVPGYGLQRVGGTVLDLRATDGKGKISLDGRGKFELAGVQLTQTSNPADTTPFIYVDRTTAYIHDVDIDGHPTLRGDKCVQTGIQLGTRDKQFSGYGSSFTNVVFNRLKRCMEFSRGCNSVSAYNLTVTGLCGAPDESAAFLFDGTNDQCRGNAIFGLVMEQCAYAYGVEFIKAGRNTLYSPGFWDMYIAGAKFKACIKLDSESAGNAFYGVTADDMGKNNFIVNPAGLPTVIQLAERFETSPVSKAVYQGTGDFTAMQSTGVKLGPLTVVNATLRVSQGRTYAAGAANLGSIVAGFRPPVEVAGTFRASGNWTAGGATLSADGGIWVTVPATSATSTGELIHVSFAFAS